MSNNPFSSYSCLFAPSLPLAPEANPERKENKAEVQQKRLFADTRLPSPLYLIFSAGSLFYYPSYLKNSAQKGIGGQVKKIITEFTLRGNVLWEIDCGQSGQTGSADPWVIFLGLLNPEILIRVPRHGPKFICSEMTAVSPPTLLAIEN